jgi:hypothetical protein
LPIRALQFTACGKLQGLIGNQFHNDVATLVDWGVDLLAEDWYVRDE